MGKKNNKLRNKYIPRVIRRNDKYPRKQQDNEMEGKESWDRQVFIKWIVGEGLSEEMKSEKKANKCISGTRVIQAGE